MVAPEQAIVSNSHTVRHIHFQSLGLNKVEAQGYPRDSELQGKDKFNNVLG